jgi:cellulose synthase operon protein C
MATTALGRLARLAPALLILCVAPACAAGRGASADALIQRGDRYAAARQFRAAAIEYKNAVKRDPNSAVAHRKLADSELQLHQPDKALDSYMRALEIDRTDAATHLRAGSLFLLRGDFDRAASHARDVLDADSTNLDAHLLLANALAGMRDVRGALANLENAVAINPAEWKGHSMLGQLHWIDGDAAAAEASFLNAIEIAPDSPQPHLALGQFYWGLGRVAAAEAEFQRALALDPKNHEANGTLAQLYMTTGRAARAEPYVRTVASDPADPASRFALADYYAMVGRTQEALAIVRPMAGANEDGDLAKVRLAAILYDTGDRAAAAPILAAVLRDHHDHPLALLVRSRMAIDARRFDEAREAAQTVADREDAPWIAHYLLGTAQMGLRHFDLAARAFQDAARANPRAAPAYVRRAEALAASGDAWAAVQSLERAFPNQPQAVGTAANNLAWALAHADEADLRAAATLAGVAADRLKKRPEPLDTLGWIYLQQGQHARAAELFRASLRLAPGNATYRSHLAEAAESTPTSRR